MAFLTTSLDCRGLTPALSILRIKQAILSSKRRDAKFKVIFGSGCASTNVANALGAMAAQVEYVSEGGVEDGRSCPCPCAAECTQVIGEPEAASEDLWWQRPDLRYHQGILQLADVNLKQLAAQVGTPSYVCNAARVAENVWRLAAALDASGLTHLIYFAIKANRAPALLTYLRTQNLCGVDVCSAGELLHAVACGFSPEAISFTGTSLSRSELETLAEFRMTKVNLDSLSALNSFGCLCPGRAVGLRINPGKGLGYHGDGRLKYSGDDTTKFGIYLEHLDEAKSIAARWNLRVERVHFHAGSGYLDPELGQFRDVLDAADAFIDRLPSVEEVNIGGGMGVPHIATDRPLDLHRWGEVIAERFGSRGLRIMVEPGDFLVKDAGLLLTTVNYVEQRRDVVFAGLDAGFNLAPEPAFYGLPCEPVTVAPRGDEGSETYTVVGNINEALDKWAVGHRMPRLHEGDLVALLNAGGYSSSMRSEHCLRGRANEIVLIA